MTCTKINKVDVLNQARKVLTDYLKRLASPALSHDLIRLASPALSSDPDRDELVAYATLHAFSSHFPLLSCAQDSALLLECASIQEIERDRFYKQRRIALGQLAMAFPF